MTVIHPPRGASLRTFPVDHEAACLRAYAFQRLVERASDQVTVRGRESGWSTLDAHAGDVRTSMDWLLGHDPDAALRLVGSLWRWWHVRGLNAEGRAAAEAALDAGPDSPAELRATAYGVAGMFARLQSDYEPAQNRLQESLDLCSELQDSPGVAWSLTQLGSVARERGEYTAAQQLHEQALVLTSRRQDPQVLGVHLNSLCLVAWLRGRFDHAEHIAHRAMDVSLQHGDHQATSWSLLNLGVIARHHDDLPAAAVSLRRGLEVAEEIGYREVVGWCLNQLGVVSRLQGHPDLAVRQQSDSLTVLREIGNRWRQASVLEELGALAVAAGDTEAATAHFGGAQDLRHAIGAPVPLAESGSRDEATTAVRSQLSARPSLQLAAASPAA